MATLEFTKSEAKAWAKKTYWGVEGNTLPSFTPDLAELDEEGIRHDVQHAIRQGFFSTCCAVESCGMSFEERKKFVEIVCSEAKGKLEVSAAIILDSVPQSIEMLKHLEKVGGTHALLGYPLTFNPKSEDEIYEVTKKICDSTNLAVDLYPAQRFDFGKFHPSGFRPRLLEELSDIENVVSLKIGFGLDAFVMIPECFGLLGDKILVSAPEEPTWPIAVTKFGQQWAMGPYEGCGTPQGNRAIRMFDLLLKDDVRGAMDTYWEFAPLTQVFWQQQTLYATGGLYHFPLVKYLQWLAGGNGGVLRMPVLRLYQRDKDALRAAMKATGVSPREPEEEFYIGRVNYAKGARLGE